MNKKFVDIFFLQKKKYNNPSQSSPSPSPSHVTRTGTRNSTFFQFPMSGLGVPLNYPTKKALFLLRPHGVSVLKRNYAF